MHPIRPFPLGLIALIALTSLLHVAGEGAVRTFFNVYLDAGLRVPTSLIGTIMATGQLLAVPAALMLPFFTRRFGNQPTVVLAALCTPLMLIPMAFIPHWFPAGFCFMNIVALAAIRRPAFVVYNQEIVSPRWRATMSGAFLDDGGASAIPLSRWAAATSSPPRGIARCSFPARHLPRSARLFSGLTSAPRGANLPGMASKKPFLKETRYGISNPRKDRTARFGNRIRRGAGRQYEPVRNPRRPRPQRGSGRGHQFHRHRPLCTA